MADESADVSNIEQFAFCVHCVHCEEFLSFVSTTSITGEALHALMTTEISKHGLNPDYIVGQSYDGAGNMAGKSGCSGQGYAKLPKCKICSLAKSSLEL